jgi:hypothetical protein
MPHADSHAAIDNAPAPMPMRRKRSRRDTRRGCRAISTSPGPGRWTSSIGG